MLLPSLYHIKPGPRWSQDIRCFSALLLSPSILRRHFSGSYQHILCGQWELGHGSRLLRADCTRHCMRHLIYSSWQRYEADTTYPHFTEEETHSERFGNVHRIAWRVRGKAGTQIYIYVVLQGMPLTTALNHFSTDTEPPWPTLRGWIYEICRGFLSCLPLPPHPVTNCPSHTQP